ncbi:MAG: ankyrin repeat domain-containing protein [Desulfomonilaceae bacterium]
MDWLRHFSFDAVQQGHLEMVKLLLDKCADVNAKDNNGYSALLKAKI